MAEKTTKSPTTVRTAVITAAAVGVVALAVNLRTDSSQQKQQVQPWQVPSQRIADNKYWPGYGQDQRTGQYYSQMKRQEVVSVMVHPKESGTPAAWIAIIAAAAAMGYNVIMTITKGYAIPKFISGPWSKMWDSMKPKAKTP